MKAGTTALHAYLDQHPNVFMSDPKGPGFYAETSPTARMRADYAALFTAGADCRYRGESSTKYTKAPTFPDVLAWLHAECPEACILYMIGDPLARIESQHLFNRRVHGETHPLREAVASDPQQAMDQVFDWLDLPRLQVVQEERRNRSADAVRKHQGATRLLIRPELEPLRRLVKRMGAKRLVQRVWEQLNPPAPVPVTEAERAGLAADLADWQQARAIASMLEGASLEWGARYWQCHDPPRQC